MIREQLLGDDVVRIALALVTPILQKGQATFASR
jgi:hypothetical protein